jgi:hypothetical protein
MRPRCILCALFILQFSLSIIGEEFSDKKKVVPLFDLEAEISALKKENSILRKELTDVLLKNQSIEAEKLKFELGILSAVARPGERSLSDREVQMLKDILIVREAVKVFSEKLLMLSKEFEKTSSVEMTNEVRQIENVKIRLVLDELRCASDNLTRILNGSEEQKDFKRCSVLEFDDKTATIMLSAGTESGAFCGLLLRAENKKDILIKIIMVKSFISAAMMIEGKVEDITPGMEFVPGKLE